MFRDPFYDVLLLDAAFRFRIDQLVSMFFFSLVHMLMEEREATKENVERKQARAGAGSVFYTCFCL